MLNAVENFAEAILSFIGLMSMFVVQKAHSRGELISQEGISISKDQPWKRYAQTPPPLQEPQGKCPQGKPDCLGCSLLCPIQQKVLRASAIAARSINHLLGSCRGRHRHGCRECP